MSYEAGMIVDAIVDDACDFFDINEDDEDMQDFKANLEYRISAFESELIEQTRNIIIEAVKAASV